MNVILSFSVFLAFCKHVYSRETKPFTLCFFENKPFLSHCAELFTCLHFARKKVKKVLKGDFYGLRGCCRTCLREDAGPEMSGFRKYWDRGRLVCLCFECKCRRCTRRVYGKCMV